MLSSLQLISQPARLPRNFKLALRIPVCTYRRFLTQGAREQISKAVKANPVVIFMKGTPQRPQCGFSRAVIQILELQGVPAEKMKTFDILEDPELRAGVKEFSDWQTIPQVYVDGEFVGGCDIIMGMHQSGELENLLEKHDILPPLTVDDKA